MKKILMLLLLFVILGACKKDEPVIKDQLSLLPTATQRGANTGGCLVGEEAFLGGGTRNPLTLHYLDGLDFSFSIKEKINGIAYVVRVKIRKTELEIGKTYKLTATEDDEDLHSGVYIISTSSPSSPKYYSTSPNVTGEITITAHNFNKAFLSGTFWFNAINVEGKIVEIREGRFDMDY